MSVPGQPRPFGSMTGMILATMGAEDPARGREP